MSEQANIIVELTVTNHAGVMSHITGLFARRAFNLEGILCSPIDEDGKTSRMYLLVNNDGKLLQIVKQLERLYDVQEVCIRGDYDHTLFNRIHELVVQAG